MKGCVNLRIRSKKGEKYCFCVRRKATIERKECFGCSYREFKKASKIAVKTRLKPISKKRVCVSKKTYNEVYERDKGCCQFLFCFKQNVELHHIRYRSERKDLIDEPSNCIMLCSEHHKLVHSNKKMYQPILLEIIKKTD
jgi:hypothetical protein